MSVAVDVAIESPLWDAVADLERLAEAAVVGALRESGAEVPASAEVSCLFCDDASIRALNARWRGQDKATNVLSFPSPQPAGDSALLGDIVVAFETVHREAAAEGKPVADHVLHLLVHGALHLVGHDHVGTEDAEAMEGLESRIMTGLGRPDPYAERRVTTAP